MQSENRETDYKRRQLDQQSRQILTLTNTCIDKQMRNQMNNKIESKATNRHEKISTDKNRTTNTLDNDNINTY